MADWKNKRVTILGLGRSGLAAAAYLKRRGAQVVVSESQPQDKVDAKHLSELSKLGVEAEFGNHSDRALSTAEIILTSPGIKPKSDVITRARAFKREVISDVELAFREIGTQVPFIAITGTNGKSTTTALISHILEKSGRIAPACGNIGVPILSLLDGPPLDFLVVEVSSYQLEYCTSFAPQIGVWLNLTPDHLDWHGGLDPYIAAKRSMFSRMTVENFAVYNFDDPVVAATPTAAEVFPFSQMPDGQEQMQGAYVNDGFLCYNYNARSRVVCHINDLRIIGHHNIENALAAISATCLSGLSQKEIETHLRTFKALEHRLEYVDTVDGVEFYNDSKATNTDSTIKALQSFPEKSMVLIAGGKDKGTPLEDLVRYIRKHAQAVILVGEAKDRFETALRSEKYEEVYPVASMEEAVRLGGTMKKGPVVLSPACASFDMFKDFEDRGRVFKDLVRQRAREVASAR